MVWINIYPDCVCAYCEVAFGYATFYLTWPTMPRPRFPALEVANHTRILNFSTGRGHTERVSAVLNCAYPAMPAILHACNSACLHVHARIYARYYICSKTQMCTSIQMSVPTCGATKGFSRIPDCRWFWWFRCSETAGGFGSGLLLSEVPVSGAPTPQLTPQSSILAYPILE